MSDSVYIKDSYGNSVPLMDDHGNLSLEVMMLYTEDKLTAEDRKKVEDVTRNDEIAKDALEGYLLTTNASKTRYTVSEINSNIQKITGAAPLSRTTIAKENQFDYRKMAAAIAALLIIVTATYFISQELFNKDQLADNPIKEVANTENLSTTPVEENLNDTRSVVEQIEGESDDNDLIDETPSLLDKSLAASKSEQKAEVKEKPVDESPTVLTNPKTEKPKNQESIGAEKMPSRGAGAAIVKDVAGAVTQSVDVDESNATQPMKMDLAMDSEQQAPTSVTQSTELENANSRTANSKREKSTMLEETAEIAQSDYDSKNKSINASYPGGDMAMYKFIEKRKVYTEAMKAAGMKGAVTISFDVDKDGKIINAKVKSGANGLMNEDALRVVRSMPQWKPAKNESGKAIKSSKNVVIKYGP